MHNRAHRNLVLIAASALALCCRAQGVEPEIAPEDLRNDLDQLRKLIEQRHPARYHYTDKESMDQWFDSSRIALTEPMSARAFLATITTLYPLLGDGHTMFLPGPEEGSRNYLPVPVMLVRDSLFVRCDGPPGSGVVAGERITAINGRSAASVVQALMQRQLRDGRNTTYPAWILDRWFRAYYRFAFGSPEHFTIHVQTADGAERTLELPALPTDSIAAHWPACRAEPVADLRLLWPDSATALLVVPSFEGSARALRDAFASIHQRKAQQLVLDLRGNQGGDPALAKLLLANLLDTTFTLVAQGPASGRVSPVAQPFAGNLYTLADGGCFSATGMVLAQLELHRRGRIIGEEAGGNRTVLSGSARTSTLTHSRIACTISRKRWQLVARPDDGHGVRPTYPIAPSAADRIAGRDIVLDAALRMSAAER